MDERLARLWFLKMLCYHREYLGTEDLKDQYDATLKNIERGTHAWGDYRDLEQQLHTGLTFRATVNTRQMESNVGQGVNPKKDVVKEQNKDPQGKIIYCSDYNKKSCPFEDHHQGIFNKKQVTKWHICSKCLALENNPKRSHPVMECKSA